MKGLLLKDLYMVKAYFRSFIIVIAVFMAVSLFDPGNSFMLFYPMILVGTIPFSLISYDERSKWTQYCDALPISRKQVVSARYLTTSIFVLSVFILTAIVQLFAPSFSIEAYLSMLSLLLLAGLLCPSILLPLTFHFSVERSRFIYYFIIGALCAMSLIVTDRLDYGTDILASGDGPFISPLGLTALFPLIAIVLFVLSWLISIRIYQNREL